MKVLIVDDHKIVRNGLRQVIAEHYPGTTFGEAGTSQEALELLHRQEWDLALLDVNIPGRSGLEVLEEVKRLWPETPVLVISAYPEDEFAMRALKLRAAGYLTKGQAADELGAAIKKALAGGRYVTNSLAERLAAALGSDLQGAPHESLSSRELQVLRLVAQGRTLKEIAGELALSEKTIGTYRARVSEKLRLSTNVELARYAWHHHLAD
jgi:two-component system invasion response regulator UvrY